MSRLADDEGAVSATVLFLGAEGGGKSAIVRRLLGASFEDAYRPTLGVEMATHEATSPGRTKCHLQLWSAGGQVRFLPVVQHQYASADVVVLVYDRTNARSFEALSFWHAEVERGCPEAKLVLVGTKSDKGDEVVVSEDDGRSQAALWRAAHFDVSARTGRGVAPILDTIVELLAPGQQQ